MLVWCQFLHGCQFAGDFCYRCRWNSLRFLSRKPSYTHYYKILGHIRSEAMFCTLCGREKLDAVFLWRSEVGRPKDLCSNCVTSISKEYPNWLDMESLERVIHSPIEDVVVFWDREIRPYLHID